MRVLVCGGRDFANWPSLMRHLDPLLIKFPDIFVISGAARGADKIAVEWAILNNVPFKEYPAHWDRYGKSAGVIRNKEMLVRGKPDLVVAFPGGRGTDNMCKQAEKAGVEVRRIV